MESPASNWALGGGAAEESQASPQLKLAEGNDCSELPLKMKFRGKLMQKAETLGDSLMEFGAGTEWGLVGHGAYR